MEVFSKSFEKSMNEMLEKVDKENFFVIATVPIKSLKLSDDFKNHPSSQIFMISYLKYYRTDTIISMEIYNRISPIFQFAYKFPC